MFLSQCQPKSVLHIFLCVLIGVSVDKLLAIDWLTQFQEFHLSRCHLILKLQMEKSEKIPFARQPLHSVHIITLSDKWILINTHSPARRKSCKYIFRIKQQRRKWIVPAINPTVSKSPSRGTKASQSIAAFTAYSLSVFSSQRIHKCKWLAIRPGRQQLQVLLRRTDKVATKTFMSTKRQLSGARRNKVARTCCSYI